MFIASAPDFKCCKKCEHTVNECVHFHIVILGIIADLNELSSA
jgi:hypothetical protein